MAPLIRVLDFSCLRNNGMLQAVSDFPSEGFGKRRTSMSTFV